MALPSPPAETPAARSHFPYVWELDESAQSLPDDPLTPSDFHPLPAIDRSILEPDWLVPGWCEWEDVVIWCGDPGVGKSLVTTAMSVALVANLPLLSYFPPSSRPQPKVVLLDVENRRVVLQRRLIRICDGLGIDPLSILIGPLFPFFLRGVEPFADLNQPGLIRRLAEIAPDLIVLDTIMSASNQPDLSPLAGIRFIRDPIYKIQRQLERELRTPGWWLVHHTRKKAAGEDHKSRVGDMDSASGGGLVGTTDALFMLQRDDVDATSANVILTNPKQRHQANQGRLYLRLDDGGDPRAPLRLSLSPEPPNTDSSEGYIPEPLILTIQAYMSEHTLPGMPRPEVESWVRADLRCGERQARERVASWLDTGQLTVVGKAPSSGGRTARLLAPSSD